MGPPQGDAEKGATSMIGRNCSSGRIALSIGLAVCGWVALQGLAGATAAEIRVINWKGWGTDEAQALKQFEERTGHKIVHDYISSYPEAFARLRTNPGYYDLVILNAAFVGQAVKEGLIQPIDAERLDNFDELYPELRDSDQMTFDGNVWAAAWIWGGSSVSYNTEVFETPPTSLEVLWEPAYANRVCWRDDAEDSVRFAALALGQNPDDPEDLGAVGEKLRALKPQIKAFWRSEDEWRKLLTAGECDLSIVWTDSAEKAAMEDNSPVSYIVAEEGAIGFRDGLTLAADAPNEDAAYAFMDYLISKDFYAIWQEVGGAPVSANAKAMEELPETSLTRQILTTPEAQSRLNFKGPLSDEQRQAYLDLWQETKAHFAQ
jgi:spermidine/putrescine transport system substrate-binding protein